MLEKSINLAQPQMIVSVALLVCKTLLSLIFSQCGTINNNLLSRILAEIKKQFIALIRNKSGLQEFFSYCSPFDRSVGLIKILKNRKNEVS